MPAPTACPECGVAVPPDAPHGLCPRCLMGAASSRAEAAPTIAHPASPAAVGRGELLRSLGELGLVEPGALAKVAALDAPTAILRELVRLGALTPYQAGALAQGKARGLVIGGYLVLEKLGVGGMGVVFKARHRPSGRVVALKILPPSFGREPDAVRRFRREFLVASRLSHPNLVAAVEASEDRGVHYLTMEYIPGCDLDRLVAQGGPMALRLALHCTIQAARGLEAAHAQGVIHRDVKPGNLMIDPAGGVRLLDLGLAWVIAATGGFVQTAAGSLTHTGMYMLTVDFLAPEQADDAKTADGRADIYSLACTLYFLLTGQPPFPGDSVLKRLMAHQDRPAPPLRAARPEVPATLDALYLRMMAKHPADRPQSIAEVVLALEATRSTPREAGDASAELKTFARTALQRPPRSPQSLAYTLRTPRSLAPEADPLGGHLDDPIPKSKDHARMRWYNFIMIRNGLIALSLLAGVALWLLVHAPRSPSPVPPTPPAAPAAAAPSSGFGPVADEPRPDPRAPTLYVEDFDERPARWPEPTPAELMDTQDGARGYRDGYFHVTSRQSAQFSWYLPADSFPEVDVEVRARVIGRGDADPRGGALVHLVANPPGGDGQQAGRGVQIRLDGGGRVVLSPSFLTPGDHPRGTWERSLPAPSMAPAGQWNDLWLRVRRRQVEVFVNGVRVADPIEFDWDLTPAWIAVGADSWSGTVRAEFDKIKVRGLTP